MCVWLRDTLTELRIVDREKLVLNCNDQMLVFQDNKSVIMMATQKTAMKRSKHLLTKLTYIKSLVDSGIVDIEYLSTDLMTADVLSKALHGTAFYTHITRLMGLDWETHVTGHASGGHSSQARGPGGT
jgi:hypothetical protein